MKLKLSEYAKKNYERQILKFKKKTIGRKSPVNIGHFMPNIGKEKPDTKLLRETWMFSKQNKIEHNDKWYCQCKLI